MSTHAYIGHRADDGVIRAVYCHWDGVPEVAGKVLKQHWSDQEKLSSLMSLGDLSSLGIELGEKHDFYTAGHGICTFYGRDRGESGVGCEEFLSFEDFLDSAHSHCAGYAYLFEANEWCGVQVQNGEHVDLNLV